MAAGGSDIYRFLTVFRHPYYNMPRFSNDIALINVATPIEFTRLVKPIEYNPRGVGGSESLLLSKFSVGARDLHTAIDPKLNLSSSAGWGSLTANGGASTILQKINLTSITQHECEEQAEDVEDGHLCTLNRIGEGACHVSDTA